MIAIGDNRSFRIPCFNFWIHIFHKTPSGAAISVAAQVSVNKNVSKVSRAMFFMDKQYDCAYRHTIKINTMGYVFRMKSPFL